MNISAQPPRSPQAYLRQRRPDHPVLFLAPETLHRQARRFIDGFDGLVSYAVKANPEPVVLQNLLRAGVTAFDVASPTEIALLRQLAPAAALHYHNPVRSKAENRFAHDNGVRCFSVDSQPALEKLAALGDNAEIEVSVRFKLPVAGAVYDFGTKFGLPPGDATRLLRKAAGLGFRPSLTFHPGTQCESADAWDSYIRAAGEIAAKAGVQLARLNVGGGFPTPLDNALPALESFFATIRRATDRAFARPPALVCEPGRALVAPAGVLALRVKERRGDTLFLNDGIYGGLSEFPHLPVARPFAVMAPDGAVRHAPPRPMTVFGPTCDSVDRLPRTPALPGDLAEGDYILYAGMGAYVLGAQSRFNGYGNIELVTVRRATLPKN